HRYFLQPPHKTSATFFKTLCEPLVKEEKNISFRNHLFAFNQKTHEEKPVIWHVLNRNKIIKPSVKNMDDTKKENKLNYIKW
ncbi:MAG: hypothetical protein JO131_00045, partial [Gammaproteobacteria bacterium]|nr:hypothetical protein [Gammaproteobacteria bacterium]